MDEVINEIEGYLLWEAEKERAGAQAEDFCARLPWLTTAQRAEVVRHYSREQRAQSRSYLERVAARSAELRTAYEDTYRGLRRRLVLAVLAAGALELFVLAVLFLTGSAPAAP
ncbi:hypothetical protein MUU72_10030 [Streptomyces sp. RS10V-4]|uniref:hypothetical protein n=1 Tax=Streptomyces rhizoryzae TaxID=2932493 RepID=UPI002006B93C|nr:hypothetical protein [Streptomyces rhizoryzae]MCK7623429.1 hypothetical protein [Streptomyces rhizoryzae]